MSKTRCAPMARSIATFVLGLIILVFSSQGLVAAEGPAPSSHVTTSPCLFALWSGEIPEIKRRCATKLASDSGVESLSVDAIFVKSGEEVVGVVLESVCGGEGGFCSSTWSICENQKCVTHFALDPMESLVSSLSTWLTPAFAASRRGTSVQLGCPTQKRCRTKRWTKVGETGIELPKGEEGFLKALFSGVTMVPRPPETDADANGRGTFFGASFTDVITIFSDGRAAVVIPASFGEEDRIWTFLRQGTTFRGASLAELRDWSSPTVTLWRLGTAGFSPEVSAREGRVADTLHSLLQSLMDSSHPRGGKEWKTAVKVLRDELPEIPRDEFEERDLRARLPQLRTAAATSRFKEGRVVDLGRYDFGSNAYHVVVRSTVKDEIQTPDIALRYPIPTEQAKALRGVSANLAAIVFFSLGDQAVLSREKIEAVAIFMRGVGPVAIFMGDAELSRASQDGEPPRGALSLEKAFEAESAK